MNNNKKNNNIEDIKNKISKAENILVLTHVNPDGDAVSSVCALCKAIELNFNKKPTGALVSKLPEIYKFLPYTDNLIQFYDIKDISLFDTIISVDCASKDRLGNALNSYENSKISINIDHHKTNPFYAKYNYVNGEASSCGEVLYDLFSEMDIKIDTEIAQALYTAILTDTGGFKYENTNSKVFSVVSKLTEFDIKPSDIYRNSYENKDLSALKITSHAISNLKSHFNNRVFYTVVTLDDMKKFNALPEHTDDIVIMLKQIKSAEIIFLAKELEQGCTKISIRSKKIDISKIAEKYDGGGHKFAAGCTINKPYKIAIDKILEDIESALK